MNAEIITALSVLLGTGLLGGLGTFYVMRANARKTMAEANQIEEQSEDKSDADRAQFEAKLREELRKELEGTKNERDRLIEEMRGAVSEIAGLKARVEHYEKKLDAQEHEIEALRTLITNFLKHKQPRAGSNMGRRKEDTRRQK